DQPAERRGDRQLLAHLRARRDGSGARSLAGGSGACFHARPRVRMRRMPRGARILGRPTPRAQRRSTARPQRPWRGRAMLAGRRVERLAADGPAAGGGMDSIVLETAALLVSGVFAGVLNTLAGGGSLLTLPLLILLGLPADHANATNRVSVLAQS